MIPIIVCICVATIVRSLHKCTIWKSWLTYCGALLRHPFKGTCCGLHSWEIVTSSWTVKFTMDHRHFWAAPRQWLSTGEILEGLLLRTHEILCWSTIEDLQWSWETVHNLRLPGTCLSIFFTLMRLSWKSDKSPSLLPFFPNTLLSQPSSHKSLYL